MNGLHLGLVLTFIVLVVTSVQPVHADPDLIKILDVQVQPSTIKINNTFSVSATILNNSTHPVYLTSGSCVPAFSVEFDSHAKQVYPDITCTLEEIIQRVDPNVKTTISSVNKPGTIYKTIQTGTANANITIPYFIKNQTATDYSNIPYNTTKSFQFQIYDTTEPKMGNKLPIGTPFKSTLDLPLKQFKVGIPANKVVCADGFVLIIKAEDGSPACVKPDTAQKLIERGWTKMIFKTGIAINSYTPVLNDTKKTPEVVDNVTYLSQTVDEWKNKTPQQLRVYYEKYKDKFYTDLGKFLIKDEMRKELERQKIVNVYHDFEVFPGMSLDSLPPDISYDAVVNATDGNSYLLLGGVFANKAGSVKITKLTFDKDVLDSLNSGKKLPYAKPFVKVSKVVISDQEGTKSTMEPYNLALDLDKNNLVTFYNNSTVPIRIQPHGSGLTVDEGGLDWKSKVFGSNETVAIQFNKTGYYEWDARSPPQGSENWWDYKGGGQIAAFSQSHDSSTATDKLKMAQVFVTDSDIPWSSTGLDGYGNLEISLYESIYHMIPDAQKYYSIRAMQLIPFDVPVIISSPSFTEK